MPAAAGGPRILLRKLREIMAEGASAQSRLDKLVRVIATTMVAEVCSIYLRRAGAVLELFATEGLNPDAVHNTRMKEGEGLVGQLAVVAAGRGIDLRKLIAGIATAATPATPGGAARRPRRGASPARPARGPRPAGAAPGRAGSAVRGRAPARGCGPPGRGAPRR